jgi:hypothetical protein
VAQYLQDYPAISALIDEAADEARSMSNALLV